MVRLLECVPNFSEGRNTDAIRSIATSIKGVPEVKLLHVDIGASANRTVITFAGHPDHVVEAAFQAIKTAADQIDMRRHQGEHPRIGSTDVCPLIPICGITMEEVITLSIALAQRVHQELSIPVYLYEYTAHSEERKNLASIRSGEYEGLKEKMKLPQWKPDFGEVFNPKTGATVIGARNFLVAYNINLNTKDVDIAKNIASELRESGGLIRYNGQRIRVKGKLKQVKAIGWYIDDYKIAQVSTNVVNYSVTGIAQVFMTTKEIARKYGVTISGSELIGLIPKQALIDAGKFFFPKETREEVLLGTAVKQLGLDSFQPFEIKKRVLEYLL